jgi:HD-like signal output (HDOD) protein
MSLKEQLAFIGNIEGFPSMPPVVLHLTAKMNDPDTTAEEIEKFIDMDAALVSYILKITNSLIFGLGEEVYSVGRAITLIGMANLKSLLTSYSLRLLCKTITHADAQQYLWEHSVAVAVFSRLISMKIFKKEQPEAYVLGLLHDVGKIALFMYNGKKFLASLEAGIAENMDFVRPEKELLGFSHIEAGYFMVGKMGFSKKMKDAILFHHNPEFGPADDTYTWIVSLSNELAHHIYDNKNIDIQPYLEKINLSGDEFREVVEAAQRQVQQYQAIL